MRHLERVSVIVHNSIQNKNNLRSSSAKEEQIFGNLQYQTIKKVRLTQQTELVVADYTDDDNSDCDIRSEIHQRNETVKPGNQKPISISLKTVENRSTS